MGQRDLHLSLAIHSFIPLYLLLLLKLLAQQRAYQHKSNPPQKQKKTIEVIALSMRKSTRRTEPTASLLEVMAHLHTAGCSRGGRPTCTGRRCHRCGVLGAVNNQLPVRQVRERESGLCRRSTGSLLLTQRVRAAGLTPLTPSRAW